MDPHFSVLLGDNNVGDCIDDKKDNNRVVIIAIVVPIVCVALIAGAFLLAFPRFVLY